MPFREKAKSFFRRSRSDTDSKNSSSTKNSSTSSHRERWPSDVYKPGEPMPRPKYRAPPKKEHKDALEAFSFSDAWKRRSIASEYSPMGTRLPSRRNSWMSMRGRQKSYRSQRTASITSVGTHRERAAIPTRLSTEIEAEGDDDVANVGMSRVHSHDRYPHPLSRPQSSDLYQPITAHDHQPFSEHDLALALRRSHLAVPPA